MWFALGLLLGVLSLSVVHEGAHWLVARVQGHGVVDICVFGVRPHVETERVPGRMFFLAGPGANLAVSVGAWALVPGAFGGGLFLAHAAFGLANLLPVGDNDGRRALFGPGR